jgi:hypothetical protein
MFAAIDGAISAIEMPTASQTFRPRRSSDMAIAPDPARTRLPLQQTTTLVDEQPGIQSNP